MQKIKVFLGGYINYTNAQNINCRAVAEHLDKDNFQVYALTTHFGKKEKFDVYAFHCIKPFSISKHIGFLWGIVKCDIAYLPKHIDTPLWALKLAQLLKKPVFSTIEGNVINKSNINLNLMSLFGHSKAMQEHFKYVNQIFGITQHLIKETKSVLRIESKPLFLGVNVHHFTANVSKELKSIVFIGRLIKRKRAEEIIKLAINYPTIKFNIIGNGPEKNKLESNALTNTEFYGVLSHNEINTIFEQSDLMFLPSKSEGFPKVILEAASAGIPSIVYNTYGASDWMENKKNGFIATDLDEVKNIINELLDNSKLLQITSENALKLAEKFDWKNVIKDWEIVINNLYNGK